MEAPRNRKYIQRLWLYQSHVITRDPKSAASQRQAQRSFSSLRAARQHRDRIRNLYGRRMKRDRPSLRSDDRLTEGCLQVPQRARQCRSRASLLAQPPAEALATIVLFYYRVGGISFWVRRKKIPIQPGHQTLGVQDIAAQAKREIVYAERISPRDLLSRSRYEHRRSTNPSRISSPRKARASCSIRLRSWS